MNVPRRSPQEAPAPSVTERAAAPADRSAPRALAPEPRTVATQRVPAASPELDFDAAMADWNDLLGAVKARLGAIAGELRVATPDRPGGRDAERSRTGVLECVDALDQLHATLHRDLAQLQAELGRARSDLLGTQDGERRARHLALHDALTTLPNRSFLCERLEHALSHGEDGHPRLAVLYFDLDEFKPINDTHGHDTGDALLKIVAKRLKQAVRAGDVVSRMGGDEFACVLDRLPSREQLSHLACKLLDSVGAPARIGGLLLSVRPSIGIAVCPGDGASADVLLKRADAAMYRAKRMRTGYAFFDDTVDEWPSTTS